MIKRCACSCHLTNEPNCICYSCECDINKMPKKQNTITLDSFNLDGTNTAIKKNMVWGKINGHISLTKNKND